MKRLLLLALVVVLSVSMIAAFSLTGCKEAAPVEEVTEEAVPAEEAEEEAPAEEADPIEEAEEVEIIIWNPTYEPIQEITVPYIEGFEELYPNVTVKEELITWDTVYERVAVGISTGTQPDVMWASDLWIVSNAIEGQLLFFNDLMDMPDYSEGVLSNISIDGQVFLFPHGVAADGLVVNVDMLKGLDSYDLVPKDIKQSWTFDDFMTVAREAAKPDEGLYAFALTAGNEQGDQVHNNWLLGHGVDFYNDDYTKCTASSPGAVEALELYLTMIDEELVLPGAAALNATDALAMFVQGKYAISYGNALHLDGYQTTMDEGNAEPFEMRFIQAPTKPEVGPVSSSCVDGYVCFKTDDEVKEKWARKFVEYMCGNDENVKKWAEIVWPIAPPKTSMMAELEEDSLLFLTGYMAQFAGDVGLVTKNWGERRAVTYPMYQAVFSGDKTPKEALDDWVVEIDKLLNK